MASKQVNIPGIGDVTLTKRRGNSNIRLSYARNGTVRISLPFFVPYDVGIEFAKNKIDWLNKHRPETPAQLASGDRIGKAHRIIITPSKQATRPSVRVSITRIMLTVPETSSRFDEDVQKAAGRGAHKALKMEADQLLPQRTKRLAEEHNFEYASITTKRLSSRWGSCSQNKDIILNTYLMQLPWHLIDYVIIHELVHTEHLNHSTAFWARFEQIMPNAKQLRKELKKHQTAITPS